ncbi:MAG: DUF1592 domain-containing protein [Polyangiaceae bacterium]|nr:DUF1592 domain-containing protein [Polyangiaceae bacterium]
MRSWGIAALFCAVAGCVGGIGGDDEDSAQGNGNGGPGGPITEETADEIGVSGLRRLSVAEYRQTVVDLVGLDPESAESLLPVDTLVPFDNDYTHQTASEALIAGAELLAGDIADTIVADPARRSELVGCEPTSATDDACFTAFVERFGRSAFRRPLSEDEVAKFASLSKIGTDNNDFWLGVNAFLRAVLQHPEFLYRVEIGEPVNDQPDVARLNDFEVATRLSYFLIGSTPPDWLIEAAETGDLETSEGLAETAKQLFADERARGRIERFHAMWLSYEQLSDTGLSGQMHDETNALIDRVVFDERRPWTDILTAEETFVTAELAEHYGLTSPGSEPGWVKYGDSRKGLLSHGTFLSAMSKFGDTSPTQRGLLVRARLFCQEIDKPPPELMVNTDMPPDNGNPNACKSEKYYMSTEPSCSGCHQLMDPIGFGLERYDATGQYRTTEPNRPDCPIEGVGNFIGVGKFEGPGELADLAVESGLVESCVARQLYRLAVGRAELDEHDLALVERAVEEASTKDGLVLDAFIQRYVTSDAFRYRREEAAQ